MSDKYEEAAHDIVRGWVTIGPNISIEESKYIEADIAAALHQAAEDATKVERERYAGVIDAILVSRKQVSGAGRVDISHALITAWGRVCSAVDDAALTENGDEMQ